MKHKIDINNEIKTWEKIEEKKYQNKLEEKLDIAINNLFYTFSINEINLQSLKNTFKEFIKYEISYNQNIDKEKIQQIFELPETTIFRYLIKAIMKETNDKTIVDYPLEALLWFMNIRDNQKVINIFQYIIKYYKKDLDYFENVLLKL